jgi:PAS domain S-box-containing protein
VKIPYRDLTLLFLLQLFFVSHVFASNVIYLKNSDSQVALTSAMFFLEDPGGLLTIDEIASDDASHIFTVTDESILNFGYTTSSYWFKATLAYLPVSDQLSKNETHRSNTQRDWLLEMAHPQFESVELYIPNKEGGFSVKKAGKEQRLSERDIHHVNSVFKLPVLNETPITLYFKIKNDSSFIVSFFAWTPSAFIEKVEIEEFVYGVFYGSMLVMLLYNFFVYLSVRDSSYLYYVFYVSVMIMCELILKSHGITLFGDDAEPLDKQLLPFYVFASWFFVMQLTRYFLDTKLLYPGLDQFLRLFTYFSVACFIFSGFINLNDTLQWAVISSLAYIILLPAVSLYCWLKGNVSGRYFFFAWFIHLLAIVIFVLPLMGLLEASAFILAIPPTALIIEMILLSFALADRIKVIQKDAITSNESAMQHLKHYRSVFNNAIEGLYQVSLADRFINANPALVQLLGYDSQGDLKAANVVAMNACFSDTQIREQVISDLREHGIIKNIEAQYQRQNGEYYWASHSAQVIMGKKGKVSHIEGTLVDITEQKEKEKALKGREKAREKEEIAKATANAKSLFLANMSHEIRTPLTAIIGYSESLRDAQLTKEESINAIDTVVRSSHYLLELINDILDFSKIEANKLDVEHLQVDVMALISEIQSYFAMNAHEKGLEFTTNLIFPLPQIITTDPTRLKQVLMNLCSNALKFTKKGSVRIDVSCNARDETIYFKISDTGIGLNEEQVEGLFDAFSQADSSKTRGYSGTGLGLSISKKFAELMGGGIDVQSAIGVGSQFILSIGSGDLEHVDWVNTESDVQVMSSSQLGVVPAPALSGKVLLAEDNTDNQHLISQHIKRTGLELVIATNGEEAVELAMQEEFDIVLMDINMPIMNGIDATEMLRMTGYSKPIYVLTVSSDQEDVEKCLAAGCQGYLTKPLDIDKLFDVLELVVGSSELDSVADESNVKSDNQTSNNSQIANNVDPDMQELIDCFCEGLPDYLTKIENAYDNEEWESLQDVAHQLKGSAGSFGFPELTLKAKALEIALKNAQMDDVPPSYTVIRHEITNILKNIG